MKRTQRCANCKHDKELERFSGGYLTCDACRAKRGSRSNYHFEEEIMGKDRRLLHYLRMPLHGQR